ncbi:MAG: crossover junction endodeoxyribonuclease RuvC [Planctomycetota bacterium]
MGALRVLGVDPGTQVFGWSVLEGRAGQPPARVDSGACSLGDSKVPIPRRLERLRQELLGLVQAWKPGFVAVEAAFFGKNARSALRLGEARGVILVTALEAGLEVVELPPAQVKRRVAGSGAATKEQVGRLAALQLGLTGEFASPDESDAVAVALCALLEADNPDGLRGTRESIGNPGPRLSSSIPPGALPQ